MTAPPLARIPVGIIVERRMSANEWIDYHWRPIAALPGWPETAPWTVLTTEGVVTTFYAGPATVGLYRGDAANYADNLSSGRPSLWVRMRASGSAPGYEVIAVTADPTEGESFTEAGDDLIDAVAMPEPVRLVLADFVAKHHVERAFFKRKRDRPDPEALAHGAPRRTLDHD
jgi:hypothetical protein